MLNEAAERLKSSEHFYKETTSGRIFQSRDDFGPHDIHSGYPVICDFDAAEEADYYAHIIQPAPIERRKCYLDGVGQTRQTSITSAI